MNFHGEARPGYCLPLQQGNPGVAAAGSGGGGVKSRVGMGVGEYGVGGEYNQGLGEQFGMGEYNQGLGWEGSIIKGLGAIGNGGV